ILSYLRLAQPGRRLEARVVDRRHELLREERPHRLAYEVGGRHARDSEAVRRFGRNRRLARARRAADEQDHGQIELAELGELAQAAHRVERLLLAEGLDRELL